MADIFDETLGAQKQFLFGCTVRSINAELGLGTQKTSVSVVVVEEEDQTFTLSEGVLANQGINALTSITMGAFDFIGAVEAWEEIKTSPQGSGIFEIKLVGAKTFLDNSYILLCGGDSWGEEDDLNSPNGGNVRTITFAGLTVADSNIAGGVSSPLQHGVVQGSPTETPESRGSGINYGANVFPLRTNRKDDCQGKGLRFNIIQERLRNTQFTFGNVIFTVDLSEIITLVNSRSPNDEDTDSQYRIRGSEMSLTKLIQQIAKDYSFSWFAEITQDEEDNNIVEIHITDNSDTGTPSNFDMDNLAALHPDRVILRKQGFEGRSSIPAITILQGGLRKTLGEFTGSGIKPFWGWTPDSGELIELSKANAIEHVAASGGTVVDQNTVSAPFVPLDSPGFHVRETPESQIRPTSEVEMRKALRGLLTTQIPALELSNLKLYAKKHWGRKFYIPIASGDIDVRGDSWLDVVQAAWWEKNTAPGDPSTAIAPDLQNKYGSQDGRWGAFMKLPDLATIDKGSGTVEIFTDPNFPEGKDVGVKIQFEWDDTMLRSDYVVFRVTDPSGDSKTEIYQGVAIQRIEHFWIITLSTPLIATRNIGGKDRIADISNSLVYIPHSDVRTFYGPWSSVDGFDSEDVPLGGTQLRVDRALVPWVFGVPGTTHTDGMEKMNHVAYGQIQQFRSTDSELATGQLEVADLPAVNLGSPFGNGAHINQISVSFTITGIKTRYTIGFHSKKKKEIQKIEQDLKDLEDNVKETQDIINLQGVAVQDPFPLDTDEDEDPDIEDPDYDSDEEVLVPEQEDEIVEFPVDEDFFDVVVGKPEGGRGRIVNRSLGGPFYDITRLNARELKEGFGAMMDLAFVAQWTGVRNLGERDNSPGLLPIGQIVTVSIYEDEIGGAEAFIEMTPPNFAPPISE